MARIRWAAAWINPARSLNVRDEKRPGVSRALKWVLVGRLWKKARSKLVDYG